MAGDALFIFSLSLTLSLQLAAFSPIALANPHNPLFLGGTGGFSAVPDTLVELCVSGVDTCVDGVLLGTTGGTTGTSSSHTFSTIPERTKAHNEHVERRRARHQPLVQRGYIVLLDWVGVPPLREEWDSAGVC